MIRYAASPEQLIASVNAIDANWKTKADARTAKFIADGGYAEASPIWSTVKPVFMALQKNKCVFCERQFESQLYGKIEFDLEHFRPKSSVAAWPVAGRHPHSYDFPTGGDNPAGYFWLPYELSNYAASCKVCNTVMKLNYFPVAKARATAPGDLRAEKAFLCYPLGAFDDDPESLVSFIATTAVPKAKSGHKRRRGEIIIDFFELNKREQLHRERATFIIMLGNALANLAAGIGDQSDQQMVQRLQEPDMPHASCLRSFKKAWSRDQAFGKKILKACKTYFVSGEGSPLPMP